MTNKTCTICKQSKPLDVFEKNPRSSLGRRNQCKDCRNKYQREERYSIRRLAPRYFEVQRIGEAKHRIKHPQRVLARRLARTIPMKLACENCGINTKLHRHHPDYNKPLEVITLCVPCHEAVHHQKVAA